MYRTGYRVRRKGAYPGANAAHYPLDTGIPPGSPYLWYDAQDINLLGNAGVANNDPVGTWKNKGSAGAVGDVVQAVGAAKPTFKAIATAGKLNNLSGVSFDSSDDVLVAAGLSLNQAYMVAIVVLVTTTNNCTIYRSGAPLSPTLVVDAVGPLWLIAAGTSRDTNLAPTANQYHMVLTTFAGASTVFRANKVTGVVASPGTNGGSGFSLGSDSTGAQQMTGTIVECLAWNAPPAINAIEAYFDGKYGAAWPQ